MALPSRARIENEPSWEPAGLGVQKGSKPISPEQVAMEQEIDAAFEKAVIGPGGLYQGEVSDTTELKKEIEFTESLGKTGSDK